MVACPSCRAIVPQTETVFSTSGDLLCQRCSSFEGAHAQVERGRAAAYDAAGQHRGAIGMIVGAVERVAADRQAGSLHSELAQVAVARPNVQAHMVPCAKCRNLVPRTDTTLSFEGETMCRSCAAGYDAVAERKRLEGSFFLGLLWGLFGSFIGLGLTYMLHRTPAEKKGALAGALLPWVVLYFILPILTGSR